MHITKLHYRHKWKPFESRHTRLLAHHSVKLYMMNEARLVVEQCAPQIIVAQVKCE